MTVATIGEAADGPADSTLAALRARLDLNLQELGRPATDPARADLILLESAGIAAALEQDDPQAAIRLGRVTAELADAALGRNTGQPPVPPAPTSPASAQGTEIGPHPQEHPPEDPWLKLTEAADYARCTKPDGRPRDSFYAAIRKHLGGRRLVRRSEIDALLREGKL